MLQVFTSTLGLVTLAELGDKTQLIALSLGARYGWRRTLVGVSVGILAVQLLAVAAGSVIGDFVPLRLVRLLTGAAFLAFGIWTLWSARSASAAAEAEFEVEEEVSRTARYRSPVLGIGLTFFVAEFGDKTQLAGLTLAAGAMADPSLAPVSAFLGVWLGASLGMLVADGAAVVAGALLGAKLPERVVKVVSALVFLVFGVVTLVGELT